MIKLNKLKYKIVRKTQNKTNKTILDKSTTPITCKVSLPLNKMYKHILAETKTNKNANEKPAPWRSQYQAHNESNKISKTSESKMTKVRPNTKESRRLTSCAEWLWLPGIGDCPLICFAYSLSSKILMSPPPGLCFTLSIDPTLLCALNSNFWFSICSEKRSCKYGYKY